MSNVFADPETWTGGSVELLLRFHGRASGPLTALEAAWTWPPLEGPYLLNDEDPSIQERVDLRTLGSEEIPSLFGTAALPNGSVFAFSSHVVIEENEFWIYFRLPIGSLAKVYPVGAYPFDNTPVDAWAQEIYGWLSDLARWVFGRATFVGGVIGWLTTFEVDEVCSKVVPTRRYHGYLAVADGELNYYPPNVRESVIGVGEE